MNLQIAARPLAVFAFCAVSLFFAGDLAAQPKLLTVSANDGKLRRLDPATGATLSSVQLTISGGGSAAQGHGLAVDPTSGLLYAIVSLTATGNPPKHLLRVNATSGVCIDVGNTGERFAGIAFDSNGQLYGVSGDGAIVPESLFKIDKTNASITLLKHLGNGTTGESITFNPYDGMLYHASGTGGQLNDPNGTILETIDPVSLQLTTVQLSGYYPGGMVGLGRDDAATLWCCDLAPTFMKIGTNGVVTAIGALDHVAKGLTWLDGPSFFAGYGAGCTGSGASTPTLTGSGTPNPSHSASLSIAGSLGGAPALLLVGSGTATANVVPACSLQILPLVSQLTIPLTLQGTGPGAGGLVLPVVIPPNVSTIDLYLQVLVADPGAQGGVAATAPLRIHLQ